MKRALPKGKGPFFVGINAGRSGQGRKDMKGARAMAQGRKKRWCMVLAAVSAAVTVMLWQPVVSGGDRAEKVRVVRVETGRVAQVLAVTGRVGYEEEYGV